MTTVFTRVSAERRTLWVTSALHFWNDAFFALLYPLLPLISDELSLSYAQTGLLRTLFSAAADVFQLPAVFLASRLGEFLPLVIGNVWVAGGLVGMAFAPGYLWLLLAAVGGGIGGGPQHPLGSSLVSRVFEGKGRATAIGTLNFAGDLGKLAGPALVGLLAVSLGWRNILLGVALAGAAVTVAVLLARRSTATDASGAAAAHAEGGEVLSQTHKRAFAVMSVVGVLDAATRGAALTFLPFVLTGRGLSAAAIGTLFTLLFVGGAAGKLACGWLGDRVHALVIVWATKGLVAVLLVAFFTVPIWSLAPLVIVFGFGLNGTSSVLYDSVARFIPLKSRAKGYGVYYTLTQGASSLSPVLYGLVADAAGLSTAVWAMAAATALVLPASLALRPHLK